MASRESADTPERKQMQSAACLRVGKYEVEVLALVVPHPGFDN